MTDETNLPDHLFTQLILSLQMGAMQQLGKIASPINGKVERDLMMAKASIDMLGMLDEKTKGNLSTDEENILKHSLYELRLNYVDELKKDNQDNSETASKPDQSKSNTEMSDKDQSPTETSDTKDNDQ